jgi:hypothetical protein
MLPAGEGREDHRLSPGVLKRVGILSSPATSGVLLRPVEPGAGQGGTGQDRPGAVESWPLQELGDKLLFDPVAEDIPKTRHLRLFLAADQDGLAAPVPDLPRPDGEAAHFPREVRVEVADETGELGIRFCMEPSVSMVGFLKEIEERNKPQPESRG